MREHGQDVYHVLGQLSIAGENGTVEIEDDIYGPVRRLCLESIPALVAGQSWRTTLEADSEEIVVEPSDGGLVVQVGADPAVAFPPDELLPALARVGRRYRDLLQDLSATLHVAPELVAALSAALPAADAAIAEMADRGWPCPIRSTSDD